MIIRNYVFEIGSSRGFVAFYIIQRCISRVWSVFRPKYNSIASLCFSRERTKRDRIIIELRGNSVLLSFLYRLLSISNVIVVKKWATWLILHEAGPSNKTSSISRRMRKKKNHTIDKKTTTRKPGTQRIARFCVQKKKKNPSSMN